MPIYLGNKKILYKQKIAYTTNNTQSNETKIVSFYDYEGTLLYSYTKEEALALNELPVLPDRTSENLTCQGWNWSLDDIQTELTNREDLDYIAVGAMYITADGATYINITIYNQYSRTATLTFTGNVTIDWGDGNTESANHTSATTVTHEYAVVPSYPAKYTIKLTVNSGTLTLTDISTNIDSVRIGNNIISISNNIFQNCYYLTSITIPNNITSIGSYAFANCQKLNAIVIPNNITSISNYTFSSCYALKTVIVPTCIEGIGQYAFQSCMQLTSITIPNGVVSIGANAFTSCRSFTSIMIPNSVTSIGNTAFQSCYSLASVTIPSGITSIGSNVFQWCVSLASVTIPNGVTSIGYAAFAQCYALTTIVIPEGVTSIGESAFESCRQLKSITIPSSVIDISRKAFFYCTSLTSITLFTPYIEFDTFEFCTNLKSITLYNTISVGQQAFYRCYSVKTIMLPDSVSSIGTSAFQKCLSLESIVIPDGVTRISSSAFYICRQLKSIIMPDSITHIDSQAFRDCLSLRTLTMSSNLTNIGELAFCYCYGIIKYDFSKHTTIPALANTNAFTGTSTNKKIIVPDALYSEWISATNWSSTSVKPYIVTATVYAYIESNTIEKTTVVYVDDTQTEFNITKDLTKSSITNIANAKSVYIGNTVISISNNAFSTCKALTNITIPSSVIIIGDNAFSDCTNLNSIVIPESILSISSNAFTGVAPTTLTAVKFPGCGMSANNLTAVIIPTGTVSIPANAFSDCPNLPKDENGVQYESEDKLLLIDVPTTTTGEFDVLDSVRFIHSSAFYNCSNLDSITISDSVISIGDNAFRDCKNLTLLNIPDSVTTFGQNIFTGCRLLTTVNCNNITKLTFDIGDGTFYGYTNTKFVINGYPYGVLPIPEREGFYFNGWKTTNNIVITKDSIRSSADGDTLVAIWDDSGISIDFDDLLNYTHAGSNWTIQSTTTYDGLSAFKSGSIENNGKTSISIEVCLKENSTLSFYWKVSSETNYDYLRFYIDGIEQHKISGNVDWTQRTYSIEAGIHILKWEYTKDGSYYNGSDCGWVDCISLPNAIYEVSYSIINDELTIIGIQGEIPEEFVVPSNIEECSAITIGNNAFSNLTNLKVVEISSGITSIGYAAFYYCTGLTTVNIPNSVTSIGDSVFTGCPSTCNIIIDNTITNVQAILDASTNNCGFADNTVITCTDGQIIISEEKYNSQFDYEIVNNYAIIKGLNSEAISDGNLAAENEYTENLIIPQEISDNGIAYTVQEIACKKDQDNLAVHWSKLPSIEIPNTIRKIDERSFYYCTSLNAVNIPASVEYIGLDAFTGCPSTCTITTEVDMQTFISMERYPWGITEGATVVCTDGTFTVGNEPEPEVEEVENIFAYTVSEINGIQQATLCGLANGVNSNTYDQPIIVPATVDGYEVYNIVGNSSVGGCGGCANTSWEKVPSIEIQHGVEEIGEKAFYWCRSLSSLTIPNSVNVIGKYAFSDSKLQSLVIPSSVYGIGDNTFEYCYELTSLVINASNSAITIGTNAFYYCQSLTNISLPANVASIGSNAFYGCPRSCQITIDQNSNDITHWLYNVGFKTGTQIQCKDTTITI